jgi:hypothetical protein
MDLAADQLEQLIAQPHESRQRVAHWLNLLATLHVQQGNDATSARHALEKIVKKFPGSAAAEMAASRMASLESELRINQTVKTIPLGKYKHGLGLEGTDGDAASQSQ